jgi:hypothetical protein
MALTLDSVLKPQESSAKGAANTRRPLEGQGEEFSATLKLVPTARSDSDPAAPPKSEHSSGMTHLIAVETEAEAPPTSGEAPLAESLDTSEAFVRVDEPEATPADAGAIELETDRERALSHEEAVQTAPPPLIAVPPPALATDAEPVMSQDSVPDSNASVPANSLKDGAPEAVVETVGIVVAASVGGQKDYVKEDAVRIDPRGAVISGKVAASQDLSKLGDAQSADTSTTAPTPVPTADAANADAILASPSVMAATQDPNGAIDLSSQAAPAASMAVSGQAVAQTTALATPIPAALTPTHAMLVASPAEVVDIVSSAADDGQADRIVVQLDPPELGRVSIDFKFDSNGLQHVTVSGESAEAVRQLRLMHFELTQALERHGISSQNMSFQQQQQNAQNTPLLYGSKHQPLLGGLEAETTTGTLIAANSLPSPRTLPGGRLDMKL